MNFFGRLLGSVPGEATSSAKSVPTPPQPAFYLSNAQIAKIKTHLPTYQRACDLVKIGPTILMAGIHYREAEFAVTSRVPGGPFQLDPGGVGDDLRVKIDAYVAKVCKTYGVPADGPAVIETDFFVACLVAAHELKDKIRPKPTDFSAPVTLEGDVLANTVWGYNGKSRKHVPAGVEPDPKDAFINRSWKYSPYVSNDPKNGSSIRMTGTMPDPNDPNKRISIDRVDTRPGVLAIVRELTARQAELA
jgi:hypothetical protein